MSPHPPRLPPTSNSLPALPPSWTISPHPVPASRPGPYPCLQLDPLPLSPSLPPSLLAIGFCLGVTCSGQETQGSQASPTSAALAPAIQKGLCDGPVTQAFLLTLKPLSLGGCCSLCLEHPPGDLMWLTLMHPSALSIGLLLPPGSPPDLPLTRQIPCGHHHVIADSLCSYCFNFCFS